MSEKVQSIHVSDKKGHSLVSVFVFSDDTVQVVDERGGNRRAVLDTRPEKLKQEEQRGERRARLGDFQEVQQ